MSRQELINIDGESRTLQLKMTHKRTIDASKDVGSVNYTQRHYNPNPLSYLIRMDIVKSKVSQRRINWNVPRSLTPVM
jgi:hypothetical protein